MAPKQKTPELSVQFTNTATASDSKMSTATLPFFLTATGISGNIDTSSLGKRFDSLKIKLDGHIVVQIPKRLRSDTYNATSYRRLSKRVVALVQSVDIGSASGSTSFPFHFDITNGGNSHDRSRAYSPFIPPTFYHRKIASSATSNQGGTTEATSTYTLSVYAVLDGAAVASIVLPVRIYDNSHAQPPAYQVPTAPDYASHQSTTFRRTLITRSDRFSATAPSEPAPLVFAATQDFATTTVPLQLMAETKVALSELDASITWRLRTSTFASIVPMRSCPTIRQARNAPSSIITTSSLGLKHEAKLQAKNGTEVSGEYLSHQDLAIALPKSAFLIPTTHTDHLSRRYSVQVEICVRGKDVGKAYVCVDIPLQIGYEDMSMGEAPMYEEHEEISDMFKSEMPACRPQALEGNMSLPPVYTR
jgi:hypothetical protein